MIVAFSTSSPWASVALLDADGTLLEARGELAPRRASEACLRILDGFGVALSDAEAFLADTGPGSFTGVRVGVILAKTLGYVHGKEVGGASAFDLIAPGAAVALPSRRGEYFVRLPDNELERLASVPTGAQGYGDAFDTPTYPEAARFAAILGGIEFVSAAAFLPDYLIEPSISTPRQPFKEPTGA